MTKQIQFQLSTRHPKSILNGYIKGNNRVNEPNPKYTLKISRKNNQEKTNGNMKLNIIIKV